MRPPSRLLRKLFSWRMLLNVSTALILLFMVLPVIAILPLSVGDSQYLTYPIRGLTTRWYDELYLDPKWGRALLNSLVIGFTSAFFATLLGTAGAIGLCLIEFRGKAALIAFLLSPLIVPVVVFASAFTIFFGNYAITRSASGLILTHLVLAVPYVMITVGSALGGVDRNLTRAALNLGASVPYAFRRVIFPQISVGVATAFVFAFAVSFDESVLVMFIGGAEDRTLPREMYASLRETLSPTITSVATLMTIFSLVLLAAVEGLRAYNRRRLNA